MELFTKAFNLILYQPLFNLLILLYQYLPGQDFGVAIIVLTLLIKILLHPLAASGMRAQKTLSRLQPKIKEIQEKYKGDQEKQIEETVKVFQKEKINPFSGFLPLLAQLPILIALYRIFWSGLRPEEMVFLYSFIPRPQVIDPTFLDKINLARPNLSLAVLAGLAQFFQSKMTQPEIQKLKRKEKNSQFGEFFQRQLLYFFPFLTILVLISLPSAIGLYWLVATIFSIIQQYSIFKKDD